jgi:hypothetical protein
MINETESFYFYSPSKDCCYPSELYLAYVDSGDWPTDGVKISENLFNDFFLVEVPEGKYRKWNSSKSTFTWENIPHKQYTDEEKKATGRIYRTNFIFATDVMMLADYTINDTVLTDAQKKEIVDTRIAFKVWPTLDNWWNSPLPDVPQWIIDDAHKNRKYNHPTTDQWPLPPFV